jgi:DNA-binding NarL/FixJ family response regulator
MPCSSVPPSQVGADSAEPAGLPRHGPRWPVRLLVVDDDPRVLTAIRETIALEADLLIVGEAVSAVSALVVAAALRPCVALLDVLLPDDPSGLTLIRTMSRGPVCAVVAMSVRGDLRRSALAAGAAAFVEKSDDVELLLNSVRRAADRAHDRSE